MAAPFFDENDSPFGTHFQVEKRLVPEEVKSRCMSTECRIRARCRDLIMFKMGEKAETVEYWYIEFVHQLAKDFCSERTCSKSCHKPNSERFRSFALLVSSGIAQAKMMLRKGDSIHRRPVNEFEQYAIRVYTYSELYEKLGT